MFAARPPPLLTCEAVVAEACFLMRRVATQGPAEVVALGRKGVFEIGRHLDREWPSVEGLLRRHAARPVSLADASLIRCAELHQEPRILTFDGGLAIYRWARSRRFEVLAEG